MAEAAARVAAERGTTYVLMGRPRPAAECAASRSRCPEQLMRRLPGVDVRIVADARRS